MEHSSRTTLRLRSQEQALAERSRSAHLLKPACPEKRDLAVGSTLLNKFMSFSRSLPFKGWDEGNGFPVGKPYELLPIYVGITYT
jgi:hypothetical protein